MVALNQPPKVNRWLSGQRLYWLLLTALSAVIVMTDISAGRLANPLLSLTLPFGVTTLTVTMLGFWAVPVLRSLKAGQVIREDGPQSHLKKAGTPTMGGIFFVPVALVISLVWSVLARPEFPTEVAAAVLLTLVLGLVGWADDWQVLRKKSNKGISARLRLGIEFGSGALLGLWLMQQQSGITTLQFPFGIAVPIGILFLFLATFVVAAESNAVNLTDGMDGLAPGTSAIALIGMSLVVAPNWPGLMIFCGCMAGGCLGFLSSER